MKTLRDWFGTSRYLYNQGLNYINENGFTSFFNLRNLFVTYKIKDQHTKEILLNDQITDWQRAVPKDIRAESLHDLVKNFKSNFSRVKNGGIDNFAIRFKSKKNKRASLGINRNAVSIKDNKIFLFPKILNVPIGSIGNRNYKKWFGDGKRLLNAWNYESDIRLVTDGRRFWLNFPIQRNKLIPEKKRKEIVALDPGLRSFQMAYSPEEVSEFKEKRKDLVKKLRRKLSKLQSLRSKNQITNYQFQKHYGKNQRKLTNRIDDLHWQTANYLTNNFESILLPHFESQKMKANKLSKYINRDFDYFRHYRFKCRLKEKCLERGTQLYLVFEDYTSKTCGKCGWINNGLGSGITFKCTHCDGVFHRDINGARNILLKNTKEKIKINLKVKNK